MAGGAWGSGSRRGRDARRAYAAPIFEDLEERARRRVPAFAFDFVQGGTGADVGLRRNRRALDRIDIVPRFGILPQVSTEVTLFGTDYAMPVGIAPVGMDALIWPGATRALARTAAVARIPYCVGTLADSSIEEVAEAAPGRTWFQLYGFPRDGHRITLDLMARARTAGVSCIALTMDAPVRAKRPRDMRNRLVVPFRPRPLTIWQVATRPAWLAELMLRGAPNFANLAPYVDGRATIGTVAGFVQQELRGTFSWDEVAMIRRNWDGALMVKGILDRSDALRAAELGVDAVIVSNHGGRQSEAAPSPVEVLPAIRATLPDRVSVIADSGVRSGLDVLRCLTKGADAVLSGRAFLYGLGAFGRAGGPHVAAMLAEELRVALAQSGTSSVASVRGATPDEMKDNDVTILAKGTGA